MTWFLDAGIVAAACGGLSAAFVPELIRPLREPEYDADEAKAFNEQEPKELYRDVAGLPGLRPRAVIAGSLAAALLGARLGFGWELLAVIGLVPVGLALFIVDLRTRYLPTALIAPMYPVVALVTVAAAVQRQDWGPVLGAAIGWLVFGGFFALIWAVLPAGGLGYGDVRLAGLLGLALGLVSWGAVALGMFAGVLLAGLVATGLLVFRRRSHYPYGPYLLLGALIGAAFGRAFAAWYWPAG